MKLLVSTALLFLFFLISTTTASMGRVPCNATSTECPPKSKCWEQSGFCLRDCRRKFACFEGTWCDDIHCYSTFCRNIDCPPLDIPDEPPVGRRLGGFY